MSITAKDLRKMMPQNQIDEKKIHSLIEIFERRAKESAIKGYNSLSFDISNIDFSFMEQDYLFRELKSSGFKIGTEQFCDSKTVYRISW